MADIGSDVIDVSQLDGNFKEQYEDRIKELVPEGIIIYSMIPFVEESKRNGANYNQPVVLGLEHGFSYGGSSGDMMTLAASIAHNMKNAEVAPYTMALRSGISQQAISRSASRKAAFDQATKLLFANMYQSFARRLEVNMLYGQVGIGVVDGAPDTNVVTINADEWAAGIWAGSENMRVEVFSADLATKRTPVEAAGYKVTAVSFENKTITLDDDQNIVDTDRIFYAGAMTAGGTANEAAGLYKIMTNTGSLFGISAATYNLWKGNEISDALSCSFATIEKAIAKAVPKGLTQEDVVCMLSPVQWNVVLDDLAAKRAFDSSFKTEEGVEGHTSIKFYGQNGMVELIPSIYVKESHAFIFCKKDLLRVGSSDLTFNRNIDDMGGVGKKFFRELENQLGYELRAYSDQALFCCAPGKTAILTDLNIPA
jgi:hypothetical protein